MRPTTHRLLVLAPVFAVSAVLACGGDDLSTGPSSSSGNIRYTARVERVQTGSVNFMTVVVTLRNTTSAHETRTYPASCPVQIRLYRVNDDVRVYDESTRNCPAEPVVTLNIDGLATKELQSGLRSPGAILGDSLPSATYTVRAWVKTEGTKEILVDAGTVVL